MTVCLLSVTVLTHEALAVPYFRVSVLFREIEAYAPTFVKSFENRVFMWCGCTYDSVRERWIESSIRIEHILIIHIEGGTLGD